MARKRKTIATGLPTEHEEQTALFQWAELHENRYPELALMFAIPNGGHRHIQVAIRMRDEGLKAGVPDIFLAVPRGMWHGLFIEMKVGGNKPTGLQKQWLEMLGNQGYNTAVCYGWRDAADVIEKYLEFDRIIA